MKGFFDIDFSSIQTYFVSLALSIIITYLMIFVIRKLLGQIFKHTSIMEDKKKETIESVVKNTSRYILAIIILIVAIKPFVVGLKEVILAGGIIAAVIGFGAQKLINDLLSGIFMIFEGTIKRGDFIHINGEPDGGTVEELGFRIVKIRLINGKLVTISNGEIREIVNGSVEKRRIFESIIVSFNQNPGIVKNLLQEVCDELNQKQEQYLKIDKETGEFVEMYRVYGLHSLDVSPLGYKFSIVATVNDTDYLIASLETKEILAQKLYDNQIKMAEQFINRNQSH
ncbi:mechanosensitive ion channel family protein [Lederbergia citrea]|uniref:Mechanosensitive ion channel family protein n=1 Tax=Lederbergia citrea TaxID=2833581 RepID=A0A942Z583_9BACI|nr:mechanosensitive ion channel domain-containing protein [Lederbergia citrea]MBS4179408.1 mechanosensitive ion channel family protein [Lederbergia citrea]MBS4206077.1 mechanosensitive ion channel family protein [Lederbergia citrea]MBS4224474.1 mechanosensitive ion channel family protein [Lederbergia citrea]